MPKTEFIDQGFGRMFVCDLHELLNCSLFVVECEDDNAVDFECMGFLLCGSCES